MSYLGIGKINASLYSSRLSIVHATGNVAAGGSTLISIQPPADETWLIYLSVALDAAASDNYEIEIEYYDGTTVYGTVVSRVAGLAVMAADADLGAQHVMRITNGIYARIRLENHHGASAATYRYSYFGWKE